MNIPNAGDAETAAQAQVDSRDFKDILALGVSLTGVLSGCAVTAQGSPNMTVAVAAGTVCVDGVGATVTSGNVTITTADGTNPRFDLICVDSTGAKSAVAGSAAAVPVFPDPAGKVVLAAVYVPASDTTMEAAKIVDKRVLLPAFTEGGKPSVGTFTDSFFDAPVGTSMGAFLASPADNKDHFFPMPLMSPLSITGISLYVTTAFASTKLARLGLYRADANWLPTALVVDAGTVAIDTTGEKTATFSAIRLKPSRYLAVMNHNDATVAGTLRCVRGMMLGCADVSAGNFITERTNSRTYAAFPDPGNASLVATSSSTNPEIWPLYFQVSEAF